MEGWNLENLSLNLLNEYCLSWLCVTKYLEIITYCHKSILLKIFDIRVIVLLPQQCFKATEYTCSIIISNPKIHAIYSIKH